MSARRRAVILALVLGSAAAAWGAARLGFDDDYRRIFRSADPRYAELERVAIEFGADDQEVVVLLEGDGLLTPAGLDGMRAAASALMFEAGAERVVSPLSRFPLAQPDREALLADPVLSGRVVTEDGRAAILLVQLPADLATVAALEPAVRAIEAVVSRAMAPAGVSVTLTGIPVLRIEVVRSLQRDQIVFNAAGLVLAGIVGLALFRRVAALALIGLPAAVAVLWTLGLLGWVGEPLNVINNVLPQIVLIVGLADAVHLLHRVHRLRDAGVERPAAVTRAVREVGPACVLTSVTTAVGFGSLVFVPVDLIARFGLACAAGVVVAAVIVLVLTPALADSRLGDLAWRRRDGAPHGREVWPWLRWLLARPRATLAVALAAAIGLLASAASLRPDFRYSEYLPEDGATAGALRRTEALFGGALPVHVLVEWPERGALPPHIAAALDAVSLAMAAEPALRAPFSVMDVLRAHTLAPATPGELVSWLPAVDPALTARHLRTDLGRALVTARVADTGAATLGPMLDALDGRLDAVRRACACRVETTGLVALASRSSLRMIASLAISVGLAAILIGLALIVAFRSRAIGAISVLPNLLPLAAIAAALAAIGRPLQYTSVVVFSVALGIVVDDSIHLLAAFRRWRAAGLPPRAAVDRALADTSSAMVATTMLLVAGFGTLVLSELPLIRLFGWLSCLAFLVALAADLIVLPAHLSLLRNEADDAARSLAASTSWAERPATDEDARVAAYARDVADLQRWHASRDGVIRRGAHARTLAGLPAIFRVHDGLPPEARHGLFAKPGTYRAWVRFSNGYSGVESDWVPVPRGLAVKVLQTGSPTIERDPAGPDTQDFTATNGGIRPKDAHEVMILVRAARRRWLAPVTILRHAARSLPRLARDMAALARPVRSLALETYDSVVPMRVGPYAAKCFWTPIDASAADVRDWRWPPRADYLRAELADRLRRSDLRFGLSLRLFVDEARTPIEDASIRWDRPGVPLVPVGELVIGRRDIDSADGRAHDAYVEGLSFNPWHAAEAHRPLGGIQRARRAVYRASAALRGNPAP